MVSADCFLPARIMNEKATHIGRSNTAMSKIKLLFFVFISLISACGTSPVVVKTVPVEVVKNSYISLPAELLSACQDRPAPLKDGITNGDLRSIALAWQNSYGPCLESKLNAIRNLQPK